MVRSLWVAGAALLMLGLGGCMDITGRGPAKLNQTISEDRAGYLRAGNVYCMRGWLGIFSTGIDQLARQADSEVDSVSVANEETQRLKNFIIKEHKEGRLREPLVLVGHSWGADDQIRVAQDLADAGITVDLLVTIDPVTPPMVPPNVKRVLNIYKSHPVTDLVPLWRGVAIEQAAPGVPVTNIDLRQANVGFDTSAIDHINIEKSQGVHQLVLQAIRQACPLRTVWMREQHQKQELANEPPRHRTSSDGRAALANQRLSLSTER